MNPDVFRIKLVLLVSVSVGAFFLAYTLQRAYYWYRTHRDSKIETSHLKLFPDFFALMIASVLCVFSISGAAELESLSGFMTAHAGHQLQEIEVAEAGDGRLTLAIYPARDAEFGLGTQAQLHPTAGTTFKVMVREITFNPALSALGQKRLVKLLSISGQYSEDRRGDGVAELLFAQDQDRPALAWIYESESRLLELTAPADLKAGDSLILHYAADGNLSLDLKDRKGEE